MKYVDRSVEVLIEHKSAFWANVDAIRHGLPGPVKVEPAARNDLPSLSSSVRTALLAREIFLCLPQAPLRFPGRSSVSGGVTVRSGDEIFDAQINADFFPGGREWFGWDIDANEVGVPPISLPDNSDALNGARQLTVCLDPHLADASDGQSGFAWIILPARTLEFQGAEPILTLESGKARFFAPPDPAKERLERSIKPLDSGMKNVAIHGLEFRKFTAQRGDFSGLVVIGERPATTLVSRDALLQCGVVEITAPDSKKGGSDE